MTWNNTKLRTELHRYVRKHAEVKDILIFGSVLRGKEQPGDIDILLLFKGKIDKTVEYALRVLLQKYFKNLSLISKTEQTVLEETFDARESLLFEAESMRTGENLAQKYGFSSFGLFKYTFGNWTSLQKTKFYYALHGRGGSIGVIEKFKCIKLADSVLLVPLEHIDQFKEFAGYWKLDYVYVPTLIPARLGRKSILGRQA